MILTRLQEAFRSQNWFAVAIEFTIVTAGVFLGIQFGNWNDLRAEAEREQLYLSRLEKDFTTARDELLVNIERSEALREDLVVLFEMIVDPDVVLTPQNTAPLIDALGSGTASARPSPTFIEMQASGALSTLDSEELRKALVDYQLSVRVSEDGLRFALEGFQPERKIFEIIRVSADNELSPDNVLRPELLREAVGEVNYMKAAHLLQSAYARASLEHAEKVLAEIEESQR